MGRTFAYGFARVTALWLRRCCAPFVHGAPFVRCGCTPDDLMVWDATNAAMVDKELKGHGHNLVVAVAKSHVNMQQSSGRQSSHFSWEESERIVPIVIRWDIKLSICRVVHEN